MIKELELDLDPTIGIQGISLFMYQKKKRDTRELFCNKFFLFIVDIYSAPGEYHAGSIYKIKNRWCSIASDETSLDLYCIKFFIPFIFSLLKTNIKSDKSANLN